MLFTEGTPRIVVPLYPLKCTNKACRKLNISNTYPKPFQKQTVNFAVLILAGTIFNLHHRRIWFIRVPEQLWNV